MKTEALSDLDHEKNVGWSERGGANTCLGGVATVALLNHSDLISKGVNEEHRRTASDLLQSPCITHNAPGGVRSDLLCPFVLLKATQKSERIVSSRRSPRRMVNIPGILNRGAEC